MQTESYEPLDPWYVTGFIEGEGSFTYNRTGKNWVLLFAVKLTFKNQGLLLALQEFFGVGKIYTVQPGQSKAAGYYKVTRQEELEQIVDHFERFPMRGAKQACFLIWKEMVRLKGESFRKPPYEKLEALALQLSAASLRSDAVLSAP